MFCLETGRPIQTGQVELPGHASASAEQVDHTGALSGRSRYTLPAIIIGSGLLFLISGCCLVLFALNQPQRIGDPFPGLAIDWPGKPTQTVVPLSSPDQVTIQVTPSPPLSTPVVASTPATQTAQETKTNLEPTQTETPAQMAPTPGKINPKDEAGLVFVPAGPFTMGSDPKVDPYFWGAEGPPHTVTLKSYWIYQLEVTNGMYRKCTAARACPIPVKNASKTRSSYFDNPEFENYPVIFVTWVSAAAYCNWAGGRLPTEAEWEKAARGSQDTRLFPWGNDLAAAGQANYCGRGCNGGIDQDDGYADTAPVGMFPGGASPYGVLDTAGNVWEWVFDWFQPGYSGADLVDPRGPASAKTRVIRGGSWINPHYGLRVVQREGVRPDQSLDTLGFRCVVDDQ